MSVANWILVFVLNACWQICAIGTVALLIARALRRAPAWTQHAVWAVTIVASSIVPIISTVLPRTAFSVAPALSTPATSLQGLWLNGAGFRGQSPHDLSYLAMLVATLAGAYVCILGWQVCRLAGRIIQTHRLLRNASLPAPQRIMSLAGECQQKLSIRGRVRLACSRTIAVPFAVGIARPVIVLPLRLLDTASDTELYAVISHELAHLRRADYLLNLLYEVLSVPVAFHPIVRWIRRNVEHTREAACDDLAADSTHTRTEYARALLSLSSALVRTQHAPAAVSGTAALGVFDGNNLEGRIMQLLDKTPRLNARVSKPLLTTSLLLLFATCVAVSSFAFRASDAASSAALAGTWTGRMEEKAADGKVAGSTPVYLQLKQSGATITGTIGGDAKSATAIQNATMRGDHLTFSTVMQRGEMKVSWNVDLVPVGDKLQGVGHATRNDNHSWDVDMTLSRQQ